MRISLKFLLIFASLLIFSFQKQLYNDSIILQLSPEEFLQKTENSLLDSQWFVHFYSHQSSQQLVDEWQLMAQSLKGLTNVKIAAVDDVEGKISEEYEIFKYPAFIFINIYGEITKYTGEKTANNFIEFVFEQIDKTLQKRVNIQRDAKMDSEESDNKNAVILTDENFDKLVMGNENEMWFIDFYAPWCGPCMQMDQAWNVLAQKLHKKINVGKVNTDQAVNIRNRYRIQHLPTMLFFNKGNKYNTPYYMFQGNPNVWNWANWAIDRLQEDKNDVIILTDDNFDEVVWNSDEMFFIKFYTQWCSHCHDMQPAFEKLASYIKPEGVKVAMVDTEANRKIGARFRINAWPTLKLLPVGRKSENNIQEFQGERNPFEMANWILDRKQASQPLISQLVNQNQFNAACKGLANVCVLGFLPNIQYTNKFARRDQINILNRIFIDYKYSMKINWIQASDYPNLEQLFQLGKWFPKLVIYNGKKNGYSVMEGEFTYENIGKFIENVFKDQANISYLEQNIPKLHTTEKWDGKDHQFEEEKEENNEQYEDL